MRRRGEREEEESGGAMERQSASASLDSGCRDDPYHPPSCRPGIVTVTVPDSLSFSSSLSLSISLFLFVCLAIDPYLVLRRRRRRRRCRRCHRRRPSPPRARRAFSSRDLRSCFLFLAFLFFLLPWQGLVAVFGLRPMLRDAIAVPSIRRDVSVSAEQVDNKSELICNFF